jgi:hypothetical protein
MVSVLSHMNPVQTPPHPISLRSSLMLSYLCLGFPSGLFPSGFSTKTLYTFLFSYNGINHGLRNSALSKKEQVEFQSVQNLSLEIRDS